LRKALVKEPSTITESNIPFRMEFKAGKRVYATINENDWVLKGSDKRRSLRTNQQPTIERDSPKDVSMS
jgi:hypothetical protein